MNTQSVQARFAGIIGNILSHYDTALYGLLAPYFSVLFFNNTDPLTALIATYAIMPLGMITKPLGSLFFGWIGDRYGRKQALCCSLLSMACVTALMGFLPTYSQAGAVAPILLALGRMLQSFCAAGELTGSSIFVLENTSIDQRSLMSSFYALSSMSGIMFALSLVTFFSINGWIQERWRLLFWLGSITAVLGLFLRYKTQEETPFQFDFCNQLA